jgi:hypothetical protein
MPFHAIGEQYNPMEMLRSMMRTGENSKEKGKGEDTTDKLIRWKMMNDLLKDVGQPVGAGPAPQWLHPAAMPPYGPPPGNVVQAPPMAYDPRNKHPRMTEYLYRQQHTMLPPQSTYRPY